MWTLIGDQLQGRHVAAHTGVYGNEIADLLAKAVCQGAEHPRTPSLSLSLWMHGEPPLIEWAWTMVDTTNRSDDLPHFQDGHLQWTPWTPATSAVDWLPRVHTTEVNDSTVLAFDWKFASYNVGSIKEPARVAYLRQQLQHCGYHITGLQESRCSYSEVIDTCKCGNWGVRIVDCYNGALSEY